MKKNLFLCFLLIFFIGSLNLLFSHYADDDFQTKATNPTIRQKSWKSHLELEKESIFKNLKWKAIGPRFQGGRIEAITCPPGCSSIIYVAVGSGNIWKSVNNGITWKPIFEQESTFTIGAIAVSPSNPNIIWVGSGEKLMARSSFAGTGVFKSIDGGQTWKNMGLRDTHHISKIIIDPENPDIVYVGAIGHNYTFNKERGVFKTEDGGKTWNKILYISNKVAVIDLAIDPSNRKILYAALWERDRKAWNNTVCGPGSGIYKTTDGGQTWKRLTNGFPTGKYIGRIGLAVSTSDPNVVYAVVDNRTPRAQKNKNKQATKTGTVIGGEVYRSDDKGESWKKVNEQPLYAGISYGCCQIRVSPDNENTIYILGVNLLSSQDGGKTYKKLGGTVVHLCHHQTRALHLDQHDLWIDPLNPDRLLLGNDGGLYMSYDRGRTWLHINNLPIAEFYAISVDMSSPFKIYGGTQDNAALYGPSDRKMEDGIEDPWKQVWVDIWGGGDSFFTFVDPANTNVVYYEQQFGDLKRKNLKTGETKYIKPKAKKGEPPLRYNWMTPYIISHHNPFTLYYGANKLFKSINRGESWRCISPDLTTTPGPEKKGNVPYGTITTISESPLKPGLIYVGTDDGNVWVTKNDGVSWKKINKDLPQKWISRVVASSHELGTVYVSLTGYREDDFEKYLYISTDYGSTWNSISNNLPSESINVIREDSTNKNILYVGTDLGVYISINRGKSWFSLCNNLPTAAVHDIAIHPRDNKLVIATHGRSAFVLDVEPIQKLDEKLRQKEAYLFDIKPAILPECRDYKGDWAFETRKEAVIYYYLKNPHPVEISIMDSSAKIIKKLKATSDRGLNEVIWDLTPKQIKKIKAVYSPGPKLVKPGNYKVILTADDIKLEKTIEVKSPPIND